jgi:Fur family transcriptional regulator, peroxide stress response regulator
MNRTALQQCSYGGYIISAQEGGKLNGQIANTVCQVTSEPATVSLLQFDKMENRYEGNLEEHINLICEHCKKILDYKVPTAVEKREVAKKTGFSVTDARLEYYGLCRECRTNKGSKGGL